MIALNALINKQEGVSISKQAGVDGYAQWVWATENGIVYPAVTQKSNSFGNGDLLTDSDGNQDHIIIDSSGWINFDVVASSPVPEYWGEGDGNFRGEIRRVPWAASLRPGTNLVPLGTEQWIGFRYRFNDSYVIDTHADWIFWQNMAAGPSDSPMMELLVIRDGQFTGHDAGEIYLANRGQSPTLYTPLGITPVAGDKLDIVLHIIFDNNDTDGLIEIWINRDQVYSDNIRNTIQGEDYGGNNKFGIYKSFWRNQFDIDESANVGVSSISTSMGNLRILQYNANDPVRTGDEYNMVKPI